MAVIRQHNQNTQLACLHSTRTEENSKTASVYFYPVCQESTAYPLVVRHNHQNLAALDNSPQVISATAHKESIDVSLEAHPVSFYPLENGHSVLMIAMPDSHHCSQEGAQIPAELQPSYIDLRTCETATPRTMANPAEQESRSELTETSALERFLIHFGVNNQGYLVIIIVWIDHNSYQVKHINTYMHVSSQKLLY